MAIPKLTTVPTQADWSAWSIDARSQIVELMQSYGSGGLTEAQWLDKTHALLEELHAESAYMGRALSGDLTPFSQLDLDFGKVVASLEKEYLEQFASDLWSGRYVNDEGVLQVDMIAARAETYGGRLRGTATETFVGLSPDDSVWIWNLGGENNCSECPDIAAGSPYSKADLPAIPGANETPCLFNCNCTLTRDDGVTSFAPDDEEIA